jgi:leucyl aminopeptidase
VGNSSDNKPRLIAMKYTGNKDSDKVYGFVGKGVTVDTGGYSLKNSAGLMYTKGDMGGAAAVAGAIYAIAKNKLSVNVVAVIPAAENRLSNQSHIPGDVVTSMNGKTIEILNTDAEGRLILADAITYAVREAKVTHLVDVATLTGAVVGALGTVAAGCTTNDADYLADFYNAAKLAGERYWQLPLFEEYEEMLKSKVADLKNMGGPNAGTIAAALFLREFVEDKPWVHLDIAGTSQTEAPSNDYHCFGGTGFATPSLYFLAENYQEFIEQ